MENTTTNIKTKKLKLDFKDSKYATGRRKKSIAKVWVKKGTGNIHVNGLNGNIMFNINRFYVTLAELFPRFYDFAYTTIMAKPVEFMETLAKFRERQSARI